MPFTFLTAEWRKLIMMQYPVEPAILERRLPPGLELDLYEGQAYVSLIGFLFDRVRLLGVPPPFHTRFEEVNLRYYVRRPMPDGSYRRGVVFLREIVPKPMITLVARALYGEAYATAPTRHRWFTQGPQTGRETGPDAGQDAGPERGQDAGQDARAVRHGHLPLEIEYEWKHRGVWNRLGVQAGNRRVPMLAGSVEEFITEHYWGYTPRRGGGTAEYAVEHPRWEVYRVQQYRVACNFGLLYGPDFEQLVGRAPDNILLAEGAPVSIRWGGNIA